MKPAILLLALAASALPASAATLYTQAFASDPTLASPAWSLGSGFTYDSTNLELDYAGAANTTLRAGVALAGVPSGANTDFTLTSTFRINSVTGTAANHRIGFRFLGTDPLTDANGYSAAISFGNTSSAITFASFDGAGAATSLALTQSSTFVPATGVTYTMTLAAAYNNAGALSWTFTVSDGGSSISSATLNTAIATPATGTAFGYRIVTPASRANTLSLDNFAVTSTIPEPSALATLAGLGALGLVATRRRRAA